MKNKIKKVYEERKMVCLYYNECDTESFLIGWIVGYDKEYCFIECVNSRGFCNGYAIRLIDSIVKIEIDNKYLLSVQKLLEINKQSQTAIFIDVEDCLEEILNYSLKNRRICFIELSESNNLDAIGMLNNINANEVEILFINETGEADGEAVLDYQRISAVTFGNEEQIRLEKLYGTK